MYNFTSYLFHAVLYLWCSSGISATRLSYFAVCVGVYCLNMLHIRLDYYRSWSDVSICTWTCFGGWTQLSLDVKLLSLEIRKIWNVWGHRISNQKGCGLSFLSKVPLVFDNCYSWCKVTRSFDFIHACLLVVLWWVYAGSWSLFVGIWYKLIHLHLWRLSSRRQTRNLPQIRLIPWFATICIRWVCVPRLFSLQLWTIAMNTLRCYHRSWTFDRLKLSWLDSRVCLSLDG